MSLNGEHKYETDFVLCNDPGVVENVEMLRKVRCSNHRMVRSQIGLGMNHKFLTTLA